MARPHPIHSFNDYAVETALVGCCLRDGAAIDAAIAAGITETSFFGVDNSTVWSAITSLHAKGGDVDPVLVRSWLAERDLLDTAGGDTHLADLVVGGYPHSVPTYTATLVAFERDRYVYNRLHDASNGSFPQWRTIIDQLAAEADTWNTDDGDPTTGLHHAIEWADLWDQQAPDHEWLAEPVLPAGRQVAIFSIAKTGKSLLALEIAAALAVGRPVLSQPASDPIHVLYVDMEMTADDLRERLESLDYGPHSDLNHLHYYQLADLPPLDTAEGGATIQRLAHHHQADLVVIDTMARAVGGDENNADTYRDFYRHTGRHLKANNIALLRLDHAGKDSVKGQRGSSAKDDDVDLVWKLTIDNSLVTLTRTRSRVAWAPQTITLHRADDDGTLRHTVQTDDTYPAGTADVAALLDEHDVPLDATVRTAQATLKTHGHGKRQTLIRAALKYRHTRPK